MKKSIAIAALAVSSAMTAIPTIATAAGLQEIDLANLTISETGESLLAGSAIFPQDVLSTSHITNNCTNNAKHCGAKTQAI
jgi:hypothetical protein